MRVPSTEIVSERTSALTALRFTGISSVFSMPG